MSTPCYTDRPARVKRRVGQTAMSHSVMLDRRIPYPMHSLLECWRLWLHTDQRDVFEVYQRGAKRGYYRIQSALTGERSEWSAKELRANFIPAREATIRSLPVAVQSRLPIGYADTRPYAASRCRVCGQLLAASRSALGRCAEHDWIAPFPRPEEDPDGC